jgi:hypothetical protein
MKMQPSTTTLLLAILAASLALATASPVNAEEMGGAAPPAGQMCPKGSYVIGFDSDANIVCSSSAAVVEQANLEAVDSRAVPTADDAGPAPAAAPSVAVQTAPAPPASAPAPVKMQISDVDPSTVVYGKREVSITLTGSGFTAASMVRFNGTDYRPEISGDGTRLTVTLPTRDLSIGKYPITVTNGSGDQVEAGKKLAVF